MPAAPTATCASARAGLAAGLAEGLARALRGRTGTIAVALHDPATRTAYDHDGDRQFDSASLVKVTILGTLLWDADGCQRELTAWEDERATEMITESDNDATTALRDRLGTARIRAFARAAGMTRTVPAAAWGTTRTTANDQQRLLRLLTARNRLLTDGSRGYALGLLGRVIPAQRWGTPAGAPEGTAIQVKNGWLRREQDGLWRVHSIGAFTGGGRTYTMSVLTHGYRTRRGGIDAIQAIARVIHAQLAGLDPHAA